MGWLDLAEAYAAGRASRQELIDARVDAWGYLGNRPNDSADPEVNAVRALISVLFPDDVDDWYERVNLFIECCEGAGTDAGELCRQLREAFADVLE